MPAKYIALIPAYEPEPIMLKLLNELSAHGFDLVIVDDGSGAEYAELFSCASSFGSVLTHSVNRGKGAALKTGLSFIQSDQNDDCVIVTVDADGQHRLEDALNVCRIAEQHPDTLVLGSRILKDNVPLRSQLGNSVTRFVYCLTTGLKVHDTQTGLRAFSSRHIPALLEISGERYEYEMNVLLEFAHQHTPIQEVEIETIYLNNNAASHFNTLKDSCRIYKEILKFSASSFIGFLVDYGMYSLLLLLTANLRLSNILARVFSASANYTLNRKFVFKSNHSIARSAAQYFLLAALILLGNTFVLELLVNTCGIHEMLSKILTEIVFFFLSWLVQHSIIFRKRNSDKPTQE